MARRTPRPTRAATHLGTTTPRLLALLVAAVLTMLAACTGGDGTVATTTTAPTTTTLPETTTTTAVPMDVGTQLFVHNPEPGHCYDLRVLETGDRVRLDQDGTLRSEDQVVLLLDCAEPHQYEVAGVVELPFAGAERAGDDELVAAAKRLCPPVFGSWVGTGYERSSLEIGWVLPSDSQWDAGRKSIACLVLDTRQGLMTGTAQGSLR
jgi:hypothetical protein